MAETLPITNPVSLWPRTNSRRKTSSYQCIQHKRAMEYKVDTHLYRLPFTYQVASAIDQDVC